MKKCTLRQIEAPNYPDALPVSLADFKAHRRRTGSSEDSLLEGYLASATNDIENFLQRSVAAQKHRLTLWQFPCGAIPIKLGMPPVTAITVFAYESTDGTTKEMAADEDYVFHQEAEPGELYPPYDSYWPTDVKDKAGSVIIEFTAGYATVPPAIRQGILYIASILDCEREPSKAEWTRAEQMVAPYRMLGF